jgi:lysyl-tRNA synthetase class 2
MDIGAIADRSRILTAVREFFLSRDYLETDTPALAPALIPESCLEVFRTEYENPFLGKLDLYLVPSPEVWMKRVIAETRRNVFQVCKCFRNAESLGRIHNPEFSMLEYYTVGATSADNAELTERLFEACAGPATPSWARPPFRRMSMAQAFRELAGLDLVALQETEALASACREAGLLVPAGTAWEDAFNIAFLSLVEPRLPGDRPLVLGEYPRQVECLAQNLPGGLWKDRWELYAGGVELANCYVEEADPETVRAYFKKEGRRKEGALVPHRVDDSYPEIFAEFPPCSGVALGFDRFAMLLSGKASLEEVLLFPFSRSVVPYMEA